MPSQSISDRQLVVKCSYNGSTRNIRFQSARNCTYDVLRRKVEQGFLLYNMSFAIQYEDHDKESCCISEDNALQEAILYFQSGSDDQPHSSASSILSGRSFSSRKIVMRVEVNIDDGLSLSDSSSLASMDEYRGRNGSQTSLSFNGLSQVPFDDDADTVSSRDAGITPYQANPSSHARDPTISSRFRSQNSREEGSSSFVSVHAENSMPSSCTDPFVDPSARSSSPSGYAVSRPLPNAYLSAATRFPEDISAYFENFRIQDPVLQSRSPSSGHISLSGLDRSKAWLRDQHNMRSKLGAFRDPSISDSASVDFQGGSDPGHLTGGDLPLRQHGSFFYYDYPSNERPSSVSQGHDSGYEDVASARDAPDSVSNLDIKPRISSMNLAWVVTQQIPTINNLGPAPSRRQNGQSNNSDPLPISREFVPFDPETPPEVLQFVPVNTPHPDQLTDCSECGVVLDSVRYVCKDCGEKIPIQRRTIDKGKGKGKHSTGKQPSPFQLGQLTSSSTPNISLPLNPFESASSSYDTGVLSRKPLPALPDGSSTSSSSAITTFGRSTHPNYGRGYELCGACMWTCGVEHTIDAGQASISPARTSSHPSSEEEVALWKRSAPKQKGQLRHSYMEKSWGHLGWIDVEQDNSSAAKCSTCESPILFKQHYKCLSCTQLNLCRACYSQVHLIHPTHPFLYISEKLQRANSEPDPHTADTNQLSDEPSLRHLNVKCAHCMLDIVGARFHCAVCESFDICSKCDSTGPFSPDFSEGGHVSSHIMIKLPYPVDSNEVQHFSRRALNAWTGRDAATVQRGTRSRTSSLLSTSDARTVITSGARPSIPNTFCNSCGTTIIGIRYQCAICPSLTTAYSLCEICEVTSYARHDPTHYFFKLPRQLQRPLELRPLPILYTVPAGPRIGIAIDDARFRSDYLKDVEHSNAFCDRCMTSIQGAWFRCAYCGKDLCDSCEELDTHNDTHVFLVFKSTVDHNFLRQITDLDRPTQRPVIPYPVY